MSQIRPQYDPCDSKYICCCGCHVTTGAKILASLQTIAQIIIGILAVYVGYQERYLELSQLLNAAVGFVACGVIGSLWYGLIKEREGFIIPMLALSIFTIILTVCQMGFFVFVSVLAIVSGYQNMIVILTIYLAGYVVVLLLECWFFNIYKNAYHYIKHKRRSLTDGTVYIQNTQQVLIPVLTENSAP